jgi:CBS domain-containing protein
MAKSAACWHTRLTMPRGPTSKKPPREKTPKPPKPSKESIVKVEPRTRIEDVAKAMVRRATKRPIVVAEFNGISLRADETMTAEDIIRQYQEAYQLHHEEDDDFGFVPMESDPTPTTVYKGKRATYREAMLAGPRDVWVKAIKDPKMRALAKAVPRICDLFGVKPDILRMERKDQSPGSKNENSMRMLALGAIVDLGVTLGMAWNELHCDPNTGRCDVLDMPSHAFTIRQAHDRWVAIQQQTGLVQEMVRKRYETIRQAVTSRAA